MADAMRSLLSAYLSDVQSQMQPYTDKAFPWLASAYIIQTPETIPPDWSTELPALLIYAGRTDISPFCLGDAGDKKKTSVILTVLAEGFGENFGLMGNSYYPGIFAMIDDVESRYRRQTFGITQEATAILKDHNQRRIPPFLHRGINQAHLTIQHLYLDMRG